jgi:probable F420-dependent oxidoreductase
VRFGVYLPNFGDHAEPGRIVTLAREAEEAGWDGFFLWDHLQRAGFRGEQGAALVDPWIALAGAAVATERLRLGPLVTPLARRRPWVVARQAASLDHLSGGRLVLGVGLGSPPDAEFAAFGESPDPRVRGEKLDESLAILDGLWRGQPFSFEGEHYRVDEAHFAPPPLQKPRIPIWVAGLWPGTRPFERAARWDGAFPLQHGAPAVTAEQLAEIRAFVATRRSAPGSFDLITGGRLPDESARARQERAAAVREIGATWCLEWMGVDGAPFAETLLIVRAGPPRF